MPATVKSRVGSSLTSEAEGTTVWPRSREEVEPAAADVSSLHGVRTQVMMSEPDRCTLQGRMVIGSPVDQDRDAFDGIAQLGLAPVVAVTHGLAELTGLGVHRRRRTASPPASC